MVTMVTQRMMDNLSSMLLAKDEFQGNLQARGAAQDIMQAQLDSELARENALLRRQLLEASADNDAISKSLQERAQSLSDTIDAKIRAETEVKVLQVQHKSIQKDIDVHKYELHLLRKQLQIRNEEKEHHKKASDASYKQHLNNVKKIARLESECQRLRGLIRQRLPGPAVIAQMRAECDIHVKMGIKKRSISVVPNTSSKSLHNSSSFQAQREIESLRERLLSVEDEAKFLKEAMTKRTAELQEARQLCARTAMKLSAAQDFVESMSTTNTDYSMPSTPHLHSEVPLCYSDHPHVFPNQDLVMLKSGNLIGEKNGVYASSIMHEEVADDGIIDVNSEMESTGHNTNGELDEISCAESWASALFAELSHLSNLHENTSVTSESSINKPDECTEDITANCNAHNVSFNSNVQELDIHSALEKVNQRLSYVGESILTSVKDQLHSPLLREESLSASMHMSASVCDMKRNDDDIDLMTHNVQNNDILEQIVQIKGLLLGIDRTMEMMAKLDSAGSTKESSGYMVNDDELAYNGELIVKHEGQKAAFHRERGLSRLRYNSLEDGEVISGSGTKFSEETDKMEDVGTKFSEKSDKKGDVGTEQTDEMEDVGTKFSEKTDKMGDVGTEQTDEMDDMCAKSSKENDMSTKISEEIAKLGDNAGTDSDKESAVNLAAIANKQLIAEEDGDVARDELEADVEVEGLMNPAQAELELTRSRIATLEAELAHCMQEKADVAIELSDARALTQKLQAELACALDSVDDLKRELSSLQLLSLHQAAPHGILSPSQSEPTLAHLDVHANMKEEQELAAARAQLADCQRSIHVIRKQMAFEMQHLAFQDVINDDQVPFDTSSESSKSTDQSSHLPSPIITDLSYIRMGSSNNGTKNLMEDISTQQKCKTPYFPISSKSLASQEDGNSQQSKLRDGHAIQQSPEQCKSNEVDNMSKSSYIGSLSKDNVIKSTQKPFKSSTTSRISEFFNRAKSTTRGRNT